jgi:hypothetical protein
MKLADQCLGGYNMLQAASRVPGMGHPAGTRAKERGWVRLHAAVNAARFNLLEGLFQRSLCSYQEHPPQTFEEQSSRFLKEYQACRGLGPRCTISTAFNSQDEMRCFNILRDHINTIKASLPDLIVGKF